MPRELLDLLWARDQTDSVPTLPTPTPSTGSGQALRKKREGWGTHCLGNVCKINAWATPPGVQYLYFSPARFLLSSITLLKIRLIRVW